jgi:hypothetical protein
VAVVFTLAAHATFRDVVVDTIFAVCFNAHVVARIGDAWLAFLGFVAPGASLHAACAGISFSFSLAFSLAFSLRWDVVLRLFTVAAAKLHSVEVTISASTPSIILS